MPDDFIMNYNDDSMGVRSAELDNIVEYVHRWVDVVLDHVRIDQYVLQVALPDIVTFRSEVGELYGSRHLKDSGLVDRHAANPARRRHRARVLARLIEDGTDLIEVMAKRVHEHGVRFIAEVRMSDTHFRQLDPNIMNCSQFVLDHPEWVIKRTDDLPANMQETAMDYSYPQVRAHRLAIIDELANRPEVDGIELNCNRWLKFFQRELAPEKAPILTAFMGQIHEAVTRAAAARGREHFSLGARVSSTIHECHLAGMDVRQWLARGYLDYLIVADWNWCNLQLRIEEFAELTKGTKCKLLVQMGDGLGGIYTGKPTVKDRDRGHAILQDTDGYTALRNTDAEARACAHNIYTWGGQGISFWNICCYMGLPGLVHPKFPSVNEPYRQRIFSWIKQVADPDTVRRGPRHYHYCPLWKWKEQLPRIHPHPQQYHSPAGGKHCQIITFDQSSVGKRLVYNFRMADGRNGEALKGYVKFQIFHITPRDEIMIDVNDSEISAGKITRDHRPNADPPTMWFEFPLADCPPFRGDNELGVTIDTMTKKTKSPYMEELEVYVTDA